MSRKTSVIAAICFLIAGWSAHASDRVVLRLVHASNEGSQGVDTTLDDVSSILTTQLPFSSYRLLDLKNADLPADKTVTMAQGIRVACRGMQNDLTVTVTKKNTELLKTTVVLKDGKPLILGGFPANTGKLLLILVGQ